MTHEIALESAHESESNPSCSAMGSLVMASKIHLTALLSIVLIVNLSDPTRHASGSLMKRKGGARPHDLTKKSDLTNLYNQRVVHAERVQRPLGSLPFMVGPFRHEGVRVTTADGRSMLIHKGNGFGRSHQTVVVDGRHMSNKWKVVEERPVQGRNVADFVNAGGRDYNLWNSNCQHAAKDMMKQAG